MSNNNSNQTSRNALQRLPRYLSVLQKMALKDCSYVSCSDLAKIVRLDPTLIRKDLSACGIVGRPKVGYKILEIIPQLIRFLKWDRVRNTILVGAGNMGRALLGYEKFSKHGINIVAAFEANPELFNTQIGGKPIYDISRLEELAPSFEPVIGIITVPSNLAQQVADKLIKIGVSGIWNFSPAELVVPDHIVVEDENLSCSLALLCCQLDNNSEK